LTLISNIIHNDFIIIASDKRRTIKLQENQYKSIDDENKLLKGNNYAIGVQGFLKTKNENYLDKIREFVSNNNDASPQEFIKNILVLFPTIKEDEYCIDLNITFSGFYNNVLFSYYFDVKNNSVVNCIESDTFRLRANNENDKDAANGILLRTLFNHIRAFLTDKGFYEGIKHPNLLDFDKTTLIDSLEFAYQKFHNNDERYFTIGGKMEYCVFSNSTILETNL
jgi:hypothetical protein